MPESGLNIFADQIIKSCVDIYQKTVNEFLPTPAKCHYTFNLRDLSKVIQGMLMCKLDKIVDKDYLVQLYMSETFRVFRDRLIDEKDRQKFSEDAHTLMENHVAMDWELESYQNVAFGGFENGEGLYIKLSPPNEVIPKLNEHLEMYNMSNLPMNLVFFEDCIQHLARMGRILKQERGNAMLVGVGGSGRRSMAMLASGINQMKTFQIEITKVYKEREFHDDIRLLLRQCGADGETVEFLFSDTQIV